ncbi:hypothetical protein [Nocardioides pelophilus]|uniref:hypothetical protein n=1 Tax=Nocardioides pelophilus TaxID=2172019 RepID=UPI00160490F1|nr:hypothetical protein [Nocardioides pelophilus]
MSKTWLLRGVAVAIFVVLVGSWGVGLVDLGDTPSSSGEGPSTPVPPPPDSEPASHGRLSNVLEKANRQRTRRAATTEAASTEPSAVTVDDATDDASGTPTPTTAAPSPDPSDPSEQPGSPTPPTTPSNPPSEPDGECTDLAAVVDCALDPVTGRP